MASDIEVPMVDYAAQWKALSSCIRGMREAGSLYARFVGMETDGYGCDSRLRDEIQAVTGGLQSFRDGFADSLPPAAVNAADDFIERNRKVIGDESSPREQQRNRMWVTLTALVAFESRMSLLLSEVNTCEV